MITIFGDFRRFSAKKLPFFVTTNVMTIAFAKTSSTYLIKPAVRISAKKVGENILKSKHRSQFGT
jgi:hypothetical protein